MGHNIEQGAGGIDVLLKFKGFVASVPRLLKLIVAEKYKQNFDVSIEQRPFVEMLVLERFRFYLHS
jgi:hypothetical protein